MLYGSDRRQSREVFFQAWRKHRTGQPVAGAERLVVAVALRHPEYHVLLDVPDASADRDWRPELGEPNPFLHMALHIAIDEQLATGRPPGLRAHYARLCQRHADEHAAQHVVMECLAEVLWRAGQACQAPDDHAYLDCLARQTGHPAGTGK